MTLDKCPLCGVIYPVSGFFTSPDQVPEDMKLRAQLTPRMNGLICAADSRYQSACAHCLLDKFKAMGIRPFAVKQVLVIRKDLKMRRGKEIAQGSHASQAWLMDKISWLLAFGFELKFSDAERDWMEGNFRKITCEGHSEGELRALYEAAIEAGVPAHLITDLGMTEFHGVPTITALAIGPDLDEKIDPITKYLRLY